MDRFQAARRDSLLGKQRPIYAQENVRLEETVMPLKVARATEAEEMLRDEAFRAAWLRLVEVSLLAKRLR